VVRRPVEFGPISRKVLSVTGLVGVLFGAIGYFGYDLNSSVALMLVSLPPRW
jgi:hypothetical protein